MDKEVQDMLNDLPNKKFSKLTDKQLEGYEIQKNIPRNEQWRNKIGEANKKRKDKGFNKGGLKTKELNKGIFSLTKEQKTEIGKNGGQKGSEKIKELGVGIYSLTKEERIINGKKGGEKGKEWIKNNPQHLKKIQILGGKARGKVQGNINKENGHMSNLGKKMTEYNNRVQTCPHCKKQSRGIGYIRWHGDNCKYKN